MIFAAADRQLDAAALKRPIEVPVPTRSTGLADLSDGYDDGRAIRDVTLWCDWSFRTHWQVCKRGAVRSASSSGAGVSSTGMRCAAFAGRSVDDANTN